MIVEDLDRLLVHFLQFLDDYHMNFDIRKVAALWTTLVMICTVFLTTVRLKKSLGETRGLSEVEVEEWWRGSEFKSRIMQGYRRNIRELHSAAERCYKRENALKCIDIVSRCPPLVNVRCPITGLTPFHRICTHRNALLVSFMLSHGADPRILTRSGENALCLVIRAYIQCPEDTELSCLKILQEFGCYLDCRNKWYKIFLEAAALTENRAVLHWLLGQCLTKITKSTSFS